MIFFHLRKFLRLGDVVVDARQKYAKELLQVVRRDAVGPYLGPDTRQEGAKSSGTDIAIEYPAACGVQISGGLFHGSDVRCEKA